MKLRLELTHPLVRAIDRLVTADGHVMLSLNAYDKNWNPKGERTLLEIDSWTVRRNNICEFNLIDHGPMSRDLDELLAWYDLPGDPA